MNSLMNQGGFANQYQIPPAPQTPTNGFQPRNGGTPPTRTPLNNSPDAQVGVKRKADVYTCDTCAIEVNSLEMWNSHLNGQKHAKKIRQVTMGLINQIESQLTNSNDDTETPVSVPPLQIQQSQTTSPQPLLSLLKLNEMNNQTEALNRSFDSNLNNDNSKSYLQQLHELAIYHKIQPKYDVEKEVGPPHARQFEVKLTLGDEIFTGLGTSINRAKQAVAEIALNKTILEKPNLEQLKKRRAVNKSRKKPPTTTTATTTIRDLNKRQLNEKFADDFTSFDFNPLKQHLPSSNEGSNKHLDSLMSCEPLKNVNPNYLRQLINNNKTENELINEKFERWMNAFNKRQILAKHESLYPTKEQLETIQNLINSIETTLKQISDKLFLEAKNEYNSGLEVVNEDNYRLVKGVMRVGLISKGLLIKTDTQLCLVVLCSAKPTKSLLNRVLAEFESLLSDYKVVLDLSKAALIVQHSVYNVNLGFTSRDYVIENENEDILNMEERMLNTALTQPADELSREICLEYLREIRQSKWFQARLLPISNSLLILRLLRDLCVRSPTWSVLNIRTLEIIVDKCFLSKPYETIGFKFRSIMECLSSGILLSDYSKLYLLDPCEKSNVCVVDYLTTQQREDITISAQHALRLCAFKKIHQVLGIDEVPVPESLGSQTPNLAQQNFQEPQTAQKQNFNKNSNFSNNKNNINKNKSQFKDTGGFRFNKVKDTPPQTQNQIPSLFSLEPSLNQNVNNNKAAPFQPQPQANVLMQPKPPLNNNNSINQQNPTPAPMNLMSLMNIETNVDINKFSDDINFSSNDNGSFNDKGFNNRFNNNKRGGFNGNDRNNMRLNNDRKISNSNSEGENFKNRNNSDRRGGRDLNGGRGNGRGGNRGGGGGGRDGNRGDRAERGSFQKVDIKPNSAAAAALEIANMSNRTQSAASQQSQTGPATWQGGSTLSRAPVMNNSSNNNSQQSYIPPQQTQQQQPQPSQQSQQQYQQYYAQYYAQQQQQQQPQQPMQTGTQPPFQRPPTSNATNAPPLPPSTTTGTPAAPVNPYNMYSQYGYPGGYPGYTPEAYSAYWAQYQQYYQQWQWASMNQAAGATAVPPPVAPPNFANVPPPPQYK